MRRFLLAALLAAAPLSASPAAPLPPDPGDRIGAMRHLSPELTRRAAALVREGKVYPLGIVTGHRTPPWPGRSYKVVVMPATAAPVGANRLTGHDDVLMTHVGIGTQIDGFAHIGIDGRHFGGLKAEDLFAPDGVRQFGTETIPPVATRGLLLDMTKALGANPVPAGRAFNRAEIEKAARAAGVTISKGDVVLFHTGWMAAKAASDPAGFLSTQPGLGLEGADWLASKGVVMVGADTASVEVIPFERADHPFVVHQAMLTRHGIHLLENIDTSALARDGATEFLFVLGVPRFQGTVQMVVNPVAIR
ncbi:cyclase family protein [Thermaurantiacus sp.]